MGLFAWFENFVTHAFADDDSSTLVSQCGERNCSRKSSKGRHKCEHCHKPGHKIVSCYALLGQPPGSHTIVKTMVIKPARLTRTPVRVYESGQWSQVYSFVNSFMTRLGWLVTDSWVQERTAKFVVHLNPNENPKPKSNKGDLEAEFTNPIR